MPSLMHLDGVFLDPFGLSYTVQSTSKDFEGPFMNRAKGSDFDSCFPFDYDKKRIVG